MRDLLKKFENKQPEIVFEWNDPETEAVGWVVINSLRGGAAGGGTRMRVGLDKREVESLAKTMEVKFSVSGPQIGGAKSGINFDPNDPRKRGVLERWYKAVIPLLKNYYGTGGDLNIDEIHEVIPITEDFGLWHPQEGVINGHFNSRENEKIHQIGQLRAGVSKIVEDQFYTPGDGGRYMVADLITGYGVSESVRHFYDLNGGDLKGKKVIIQGWGNVGSAAACYLTQAGAKIVGIIDRVGGLINTEGFGIEETTQLFHNKEGNKLVADNMLSFDEVNAKIWDIEADVFIPAAASRLVTKDQVDRLLAKGLEIVACGANVPFADEEIFMGPITEHTDKNLSLIPDFISNCGMARVFAYLMQPGVEVSDEAIFTDCSNTIRKGLEEVHTINKTRKDFTNSAFTIALKKLLP
jgi:glutamate dehydrogenase/leucine dehydrogenase